MTHGTGSQKAEEVIDVALMSAATAREAKRAWLVMQGECDDRIVTVRTEKNQPRTIAPKVVEMVEDSDPFLPPAVPRRAMRRVQPHAGAGGTLEEGPRRGMGLPRSTLCLIISVLFIVAEEAEATVFYTVPKSQTRSKYERPQPPAAFLGLHRLMKADKVSGRFSSHNIYDDELGRHIKLSYDVECAPDITIHHLDDEAGLIMVNGSSSNEPLLHFSSASESQNFHSRITSSHVNHRRSSLGVAPRSWHDGMEPAHSRQCN